MQLIRQYATRGTAELIYDPDRKQDQLVLSRSVQYFGFELEHELEPVRHFSPDLAQEARHVLAAATARGEGKHLSVKKNRASIEAVRDAYRRSGGATPRLGLAELTVLYERQLAHVNSVEEFRNARLTLDPDYFVPRELREQYAALPSVVLIRDRECWIDYEVEEDHNGAVRGIARLRVPEKLARTLTEEELPILDRPLRFSVLRGQRGAVRADTLDELQELLDRPWSPDEIDETDSPYARDSKAHRRPFRGAPRNRRSQRRHRR
jgi:hypothetical protein